MRARNLSILLALTGLARRTGRFPQLVGPRSSVNGLFLTGSPRFREVRALSTTVEVLDQCGPSYALSYGDHRRRLLAKRVPWMPRRPHPAHA